MITPFKPGRFYRQHTEQALEEGWTQGAIMLVMSCTVQENNNTSPCLCGIGTLGATHRHLWCELLIYCKQWGGLDTWTLDANDFDEF